LEEEAEAMRPDQSEQAAEAIMEGEAALDESSGEDTGHTPPDEVERQWSSPKDAIQSHFEVALKHGSLNHIPEEEQISGKQLDRMYAIADEEGWKDSWLDRMVKDELGYESKSTVPSGPAYEEIVEALRSDEMRYFMSRDLDTPDLFEDPAEDEEVPV
jgi:hypothetical protein